MSQITRILPRGDWDKVVINENGEQLVLLQDAKRMGLGDRFFPDLNFEYRVRETVAKMLHKASEYLSEGYKLVIVEGLRSLDRQKEHWNNKAVKFKNQHPDWSEEKIGHEVGLVVSRPNPLANHNCGGAVDVTLTDVHGKLLDMGTIPQAPKERIFVEMFSQLIAQDQAENRKILREVMEKAGFVWYPGEWWHYCYGDRMWAVYTGKKECFYGPIQSIKRI